MSWQEEAVGPLTEQELIDWLKVKPRTFGWDAMIFYDRLQTNMLLLQEYIDRFARESGYFEPITDKVTIIDGKNWEFLFDHILDKPRLSFENSTIDKSKATLTMNIMGGTQMTIEQAANAQKRVNKVEWFDPLQGPKLLVTVDLYDAGGVVAEDGRVLLDLSKGTEFRVTLGTSIEEQEEGGKFYERLFKGWDPEKKIFVLNTLQKFEEGEFLEPERFRIRTMPAPGAKDRNSPHYGDGALMIPVSAKGREVGMNPDQDWEYLYPIPAGRSFTMLIGNDFLVRRLLTEGARNLAADVSFNYQNSGDENSALKGFSVNSGEYYYVPPLDMESVQHFKGVRLWFEAPLAHGSQGVARFTAAVAESGIEVEWRGTNSGSISRYGIQTSSPAALSRGVGHTWSGKRNYAFRVAPDGSLKLTETESQPTEWILEATPETLPLHAEYINEFQAAYSNRVAEEIEGALRLVVDTSQEIDLFRLHGLIFRSGDVASLRTAYLAADLAVFGDLAPALTVFVIDPMEHVMAEGTSLAMRTTPPQAGVRWEVHPVEGFEGPVGAINSSGSYVAPTKDDIEQSFTMVRVSASTATHTSSALVRIVTRSVVVNPLVVATFLKGPKIKVSGGTIDGGSINWSIRSATGATLVDTPPEGGAEFEEGAKFYLPGETSSGATFSVDEVIGTNPRTGKSHSSYFIVVEKELVGTLRLKEGGSLPANQAQLELDAGEGPLAGAIYTVIAGGGSVDANGLFTADASSSHKFGVVTATWKMEGVPITIEGYLILPMPLVDLEAIKCALT